MQDAQKQNVKVQNTHLHIRISSKLFDEFKEVCSDMGLVTSEQVRQLLQEFIDKMKRREEIWSIRNKKK